MEHQLWRPWQCGCGADDVPAGAVEREHLVSRERRDERAAELPSGTRYEDVSSRCERVGVFVLHRCATRGSFQGMPYSSGSAGSYSAVT